MRESPIPTMYPEAKTQVQSHLFALAHLASRELDGVRVPGTPPDACAPRHRAVGILEHLATQEREPPLPESLKDRLAEVFIDTTLASRSDMDYLLALRGLSLLNPKGPECLSASDLSATTGNMLRERRLQDIELGIFVRPVHTTICNFLIQHQREGTPAHSGKIESALRAYLDLWPTVTRTAPDAPLHPVFYAIVERDLAAIRQAASFKPLAPPKGW